MTTPNPKFPRFEQALAVYGDNPFAQAKAIGIPYTTLRDFLSGQIPRSLIRLACRPDLYHAIGEDIAAQRETLCQDQTTEELQPTNPIAAN